MPFLAAGTEVSGYGDYLSDARYRRPGTNFVFPTAPRSSAATEIHTEVRKSSRSKRKRLSWEELGQSEWWRLSDEFNPRLAFAHFADDKECDAVFFELPHDAVRHNSCRR